MGFLDLCKTNKKLNQLYELVNLSKSPSPWFIEANYKFVSITIMPLIWDYK